VRSPGVFSLMGITVALGCVHTEAAAPARSADEPVWVDPTPRCSETSPTFLPSFRASDTVSAPTATYDPDRLSVWLARRVPGGWSFGTMVDSLQNIGRLWLRDPSQKRAALAVLDTILPPNYPNFSRTHPDSVIVHRVRWDYAELYDWMEYLNSSMRDLTGVRITAWATDALGGRLLFFVETREMLPKMTGWLVGKGIPCRLVALGVMAQARM
jgi:hypothetical protein